MVTTMFCVPYAGAGSSVYHRLRQAAPGTGIEPRPVQLPGRERRIDEALCRDLARAAEQLTEEIVIEAARAERVAVFGHSFGAVLGFELTRRLTVEGVPVAHLFVSGCPGPWKPRQERAAELTDDGFVDRVEALAGYRHPALEHPQLREMLLPALRADVEMQEGYLPPLGTTVATPVLAIRGSSDPLVSADDLQGWRSATTASFEASEMPGGHMYIVDDPDRLLAVLGERLG